MHGAQVLPFTPKTYFYAIYDRPTGRLLCVVSLFRLALDYYDKGFTIVYKTDMARVPVYLEKGEVAWHPSNAEVIPFVNVLQQRIENLK